MDDNSNVRHLKNLISEHIKDQVVSEAFKKALKALEKEVIGVEFKLKRTLRDRQITTKVLNTTIESLKEKSVAIEKQKELIEEQARFKEELFANVSHELRTPLHGILGMNQLLEKTKLDELQSNYVGIIKGSADNLLVIINDLLSFSQINAGKIQIQQEPFSILKLCNDLENILSLKARKKGLNLICMSPPNLPEFLLGDYTRLYQVLLNLLNNALKFTHEGFIALNTYIIEQSPTRIQLQFEVRDTGIGIKPERLDMVFESFTQVHDPTGTVYEGAGLGLNIVKNLLNLMDGGIEVKSEEGKGTSFLIKLSFDIPDEKAVEAFKNKRSELSIPAHWKYKNILLIEDNKANLLYAKNLFLDWGIELVLAETIAEAQAKILAEKFDCILSDVKLPDGNGLEFIKQMREDHTNKNQHTPVMVLTASSNDKEASYSRQIKVQSYIGKPFKPSLLTEELKKMLDEPQSNIDTLRSVLTAKKTLSSTPYFEPLEKNFCGKNNLKIEMIDIFLDQIPSAIQKMADAISVQNLKDFHFAAHSIKSTIFNIGLPKLQSLITQIDEYCYKEIHLDELPGLFDSFKKATIEDIQIIMREKEKLLVVSN